MPENILKTNKCRFNLEVVHTFVKLMENLAIVLKVLLISEFIIQN